MKTRKLIITAVSFFLVIFISIFIYEKLSAHCDTLDGPVVKACKDALEKENVNYVLIWVQPKDENTIKEVFRKTIAVRKISPEAKEIADMSFFETVVRVHRQGEGAAYTGLKPSGLDMGPAIPAGDKAIEEGKIDDVQKLIKETIQENLSKYFKEVMEKKNYNPDEVSSGREYVKAYVEYIHYVERLYEAAKGPAEEHIHGTDESLIHTDEH